MRQFVLEKNPDKKGIISLSGKDYRYLRQVLRVKTGDMVSVRLPDGSLKNSTVAKVDENQRTVTLQICADTSAVASGGAGSSSSLTRGVQAEEIQQTVQNNLEYWLFQFIPKPQKFEQIVRQATECGVKRIVPIIGEYSEKSSISALQGQGAKKERIERIIKEARQQSGSPVNTLVEEPLSLERAVELWLGQGGRLEEKKGSQPEENAEQVEAATSLAFVLSERNDGDGNIRKILQKEELKGKIARIGIACGSEGGISPQEVDYLVKKGLFYPLHFSVNILRCETAALYGIAAVQTCVNAEGEL